MTQKNQEKQEQHIEFYLSLLLNIGHILLNEIQEVD